MRIVVYMSHLSLAGTLIVPRVGANLAFALRFLAGGRRKGERGVRPYRPASSNVFSASLYVPKKPDTGS